MIPNTNLAKETCAGAELLNCIAFHETVLTYYAVDFNITSTKEEISISNNNNNNNNKIGSITLCLLILL